MLLVTVAMRSLQPQLSRYKVRRWGGKRSHSSAGASVTACSPAVWAFSTVILPAGMGEVLGCFACLCSCLQRAAAGSSLIGTGVQ